MPENGDHGKDIRISDEVEQSKENKIDKNRIKQTRISQALELPVLCNINPRSAYNKQNELCDFIKEEQCDLIFISESWERENLSLKEIITKGVTT